MPRTRPSVGCSAMVRTRLSPMCCATSQMMSMGSGTLNPSLVMRIAVRMTGICPSGNSHVHGRSGHLDHFAYVS